MTAANYEEAISTLKKRFGNKQLIVNKHMNNLLSLGSHHNAKNLCHLFNSVETEIRGLSGLIFDVSEITRALAEQHPTKK